jgi:hypothetical protein
MTNKLQRLCKKELMNYWRGIEPQRPIRMSSIPYRHKGSTFGEDSIRVSGTREFIDSVLSRLKDLLEYESIKTRLQVSYQQCQPKDGNWVPEDAWVCYIQVHERGGEAIMANSILSARAGRQVLINGGY